MESAPVKGQQECETLAVGDGPVRLRTGLAIFPLEDGAVVFSQEAQSLIALNSSAAFAFRSLESGASAAFLAERLVTEGFSKVEDADAWVGAVLEAFSSQGFLADGRSPTVATRDGAEDQPAERAVVPMPPYQPFEVAAEKRYRLLGTSALLRFAHNLQVRHVDSVIGHLASDDGGVPDVVLDVNATKLEDGHLMNDVYVNARPYARARRLSTVGPVIKSVLWHSAVEAYDYLFYFHAGVVGTGGSCILLPAAAGSGKSSLTAALTRAGFGYFSDEIALIDRATFKVPAVPLAMCVKGTGWNLIAKYYPEIASVPTHWRADRRRVRYVPPPRDSLSRAPAPVSQIIFPRYEPDTTTALIPISRPEALSRLMRECIAKRVHLDHDAAKRIVDWIAQIDCYALTFSSLDEAVELVTEVTQTGKV